MEKLILTLSAMTFLFSLFFYFNRENQPKKVKKSRVNTLKSVSTITDKELAFTNKLVKNNLLNVGKAKTRLNTNVRLNSKTKNANNDNEESLDPIKQIISDKKYLYDLRSAYRRGESHRVIELAKNSFDKLKDDYEGTWVYGDFLHWTKIQIGKSYLKIGNILKAEEYLLKPVDKKIISKTGNKMFSPMLVSFGPDRSLTYDLYQLNRILAVKNILIVVKVFG